ncbi:MULTISPECIES: hypothetical protein [unclassified Corynebacterium]|uniref:hypothetical protein n=1 Tax=unclassified Corynebacterium TaxID=2624378 RepID=UPI0032EF1B1C
MAGGSTAIRVMVCAYRWPRISRTFIFLTFAATNVPLANSPAKKAAKSSALVPATPWLSPSVSKTGFQLHYRDISDYLTVEEKLGIVDSSAIETIDWQSIEPNEEGDWLHQHSEEFEKWPVLGAKAKQDFYFQGL